LLAAIFVPASLAATYLSEKFDDGDKWRARWVDATWKIDDNTAGVFKLTAGGYPGSETADVGIQTTDDFRFYTISTKLSKPFQRKSGSTVKDLVVQYSVKHEQKWIECGGGYIKLLPQGLNQPQFTSDTQEVLTFGPDLCGTETRNVIVAPRADGRAYPLVKDIRCESDKLTHFYTLIIRQDDSFEVRIDGEKREEGKLSDDFGIPNVDNLALNEEEIGFLGIEIWQVRGGTLFDNFLITDSISDAEAAIKRFEDGSRDIERNAWEAADRLEQDAEENIRRQIEEERARQDEELSRRVEQASEDIEHQQDQDQGQQEQSEQQDQAPEF